MKFHELFLFFIIFSFIGWCVEVVYTFIGEKRWINRGFLIGPYCPIYGCGCLLIVFLLKRYYNDPIVLIILSLVICSILEYFTSFILEKIFKTRWWDYSKRKFNINGRICLETLIPFSLCGPVVVYVLNPAITKLLNIIPVNIKFIIFVLLIVLFITDLVFSLLAMAKVHVSSKKISNDGTEEVTKLVKDYLMKHSKLASRLFKSFPNIKVYRKKSKKSKK